MRHSVRLVSMWSVVGLLVLAVATGVVTTAFAQWGYREVRQGCRTSSPDAVETCVADTSMGVDVIGLIGVIVSLVFLVMGINALRRVRGRSSRRSGAHRVVAAVDVDDLAGGGGEPVGQERHDGPSDGL